MKNDSIKRILLIEDNPGDVRLLREMLNEQNVHNIEMTHVDCMAGAERYLAERAVDVILLDLGLPDVQGLEAVRRASAAAPRVSLVVLSGLDDESMALQAMQEGAQDYLIKGQIEPREFLRALRYAAERKIVEDRLWLEKERAQVTLDCIGDAVICTDSSENITFINRTAEKMTGWLHQEGVGHPVADAFHVVDSANRETISNRLDRADGEDHTGHLPPEWVLISRDKVRTPIEYSVSPIYDRAGDGAGAVVIFRDVSAARALSQQTTHSAGHDCLTGLPNRMLMNDRINQAIVLAPRHGKKVALLFLDLDGFKAVNDFLGHSVGDKLLQSIARCLRSCVRLSDTVSRRGGDEFVVLLSEVEHAAEAAITAKRLLAAVAETHSIDDNDLHVTTSIGVSVYPDDGLDAETLIKNADIAMYQAKENGGRGYRFFKRAMNIEAAERQSMEEGLECALQNQEFILYYQPKISLITGEITGAEALIRWTHPSLGMICPGDFIPIAEECGLIVPIGRWVLREACTQAQAWRDFGLPLTMGVNISAAEFRDKNFLETVFAILEETGLHPSSLQLELPESVLMKHTEFAAQTLGTLREKGVQLTVDDFGNGYSNLNYLKKFSIDSFNIAPAFVSRVVIDSEETAFVSKMIATGQNLELRVVAEGVETEDQLAFLQSHRCDVAQGSYFSPPVPPQQFSVLLAARSFQLAQPNRRTSR